MNGLLVGVSVAAAVAFAGAIAFMVLFFVYRSRLARTRKQLEAYLAKNPRRRRRLGIAPLAIKTVWETADALRTQGIGSVVRNSVEDLAGWARVERPDLARLAAGGEVVIAFSDIEGSTELNETLGDQAWVKLLERHDKLIRGLVEDHDGHVVKNQGDGYMIAFADAEQAVRFAMTTQTMMAEDTDRWGGIRIRIGIHMGSSVRRGDDLFGRNVAMAARVAGQAHGGETLLSEAVRDSVGDPVDMRFGPSREVELKGLKGAHALFPVLAVPQVSP